MQQPHPASLDPAPETASAASDGLEVIDLVGDRDERLDGLMSLAAAVIGGSEATCTLVGKDELVHLGCHPTRRHREPPMVDAPAIERFVQACVDEPASIVQRKVTSVEGEVRWLLGLALTSPAGAAIGAPFGVIWIARDTELDLDLPIRRRLRAVREMAEALLRVEPVGEGDRLTHLVPRRTVTDMVRRHWQAATHSGAALSVLVIEIDFLRLYGDRFGDRARARCVARVADAVAGALHRPTSTVVRWDDHQLVVMLPARGRHGASSAARAVHEAVRAVDLPSPVRTDLRVTVSVGAATATPATGEGAPRLLLGAAEQALGAVRASGGDGISHAALTSALA